MLYDNCFVLRSFYMFPLGKYKEQTKHILKKHIFSQIQVHIFFKATLKNVWPQEFFTNNHKHVLV